MNHTPSFRERHLAGPGGIAELWRIALPMVFSSAFDTAMMFIDRLFLARVDPLQMAACMSGGLTCFATMTFPIGIIGYVTALAAHQYGAERKTECARVTTQGLILALIAWPLVLLLAPLAASTFAWAGHAPEQIRLETKYFWICAAGSVFGLLRTALAGFFSGIGRTRPIMLANLAGLLVNSGVGYVLIFGKLGFPALGITGAGIGILCSSLAALLVLVTAYLRRENRSEFRINEAWGYDRALMGRLLKLGLPCGVELLLNLGAFTMIVSLFHSYGARVASAVTIAFNWDMVAFVPMIGLQVAVTSLVGQSLGRGDVPAAIRSAWSGLKMNVVYSGCMLLLFLTVPDLLIRIFRPDAPAADFPEIAAMARTMIMLISIYPLSDGLFLVFSGVLRGAGDTAWAMRASVLLHWSAAVNAILCTKILHLPPVTAWSILVFNFPIFGLVFWLRFRSNRWQGKTVLECGEAAAEPAPVLPAGEG